MEQDLRKKQKQNPTYTATMGPSAENHVGMEIIGSEDPNAQMQVMNHQSVLDIILFEYLYKRVHGFEPRIKVWKTLVLPLHHIRTM